MPDINIDGENYDLDSLSDETKANLASLQFVDQEIARLNMMLAAMHTSRMGYARAVKDAVSGESDTTSDDVEISGLGENISFD